MHFFFFLPALFSLPRLWKSTHHSSWRTLWRCTWTMPPGLLMSWGSFRRTCARMAGILLTLSTSSSGKWLFLCLKKKKTQNLSGLAAVFCLEVEVRWRHSESWGEIVLCSSVLSPGNGAGWRKADFSSLNASTQCSGCQEVSGPLWAAGHQWTPESFLKGREKAATLTLRSKTSPALLQKSFTCILCLE